MRKGSLGRVRVAAPCAASWAEMRGDDRVRFCDQCGLNVYNLSGMTRREAERLVAGRDERLCVRFYRAADGTVLTRNCPVGLRALRRRVASVAGMAFAAVTTFLVVAGSDAPARVESAASELTLTVAAEVLPESVYAECMGACSGPADSPLVAGGFLASAAFVLGYPLLKLHGRREARRRAQLHIWRG